MPGFIKSISELALWVQDVERSMQWYCDRLGFSVQSHEPGKHAFLKSGDFLLVLFNPKDPGTDLAAAYLAEKGGPNGSVYHVAFRVDGADLDKVAGALGLSGESVKGPIEFGTGRRSYFVEDPDRHYIELTDR
ncbi:MAG: VOC family protein [Fimbriimonadales bacterium]|nr:VOC family protein [Fimbriimonadales bacterium]